MTSEMTHQYTPNSYSATRNEVGVFTTPPYSDHIKPFWRFKDADAASKSSEEIWTVFERYRGQGDFVGMDIARKFIQMGRTRSLRYALRPSGRKYSHDTSTGEKKEMKRTGKVYDEEKYRGANVFERVLKRVWEDEVYKSAFEEWKRGKGVGKAAEKDDGGEVSDQSDRSHGAKRPTATEKRTQSKNDDVERTIPRRSIRTSGTKRHRTSSRTSLSPSASPPTKKR